MWYGHGTSVARLRSHETELVGSNSSPWERVFPPGASLDEIVQKIEAVTAEELMAMSNQYFHPDKIAVTFLGNLDGLKLSREALAC